MFVLHSALLFHVVTVFIGIKAQDHAPDKKCIDLTGNDWTQNPTGDEFDPLSNLQRCQITDEHTNLCLVERKMICAGHVTCLNLTPCDIYCGTYYLCQNSGDCKSRTTICNGDSCDGCPEDHDWKNGVGFKCLRNGRECLLPQQLLHDGIADCDGGADLCFEVPSNITMKELNGPNRPLARDTCFQCLDNSMLVPATRVCDGIIDCSDLSDECLCEDKSPDICRKVIMHGEENFEEPATVTPALKNVLDRRVDDGNTTIKPINPLEHSNCTLGHVRCSNGLCVSRENICDGVRSCDEDERFDICRGTMKCGDATNLEPTCRCKRLCESRYGTACDGRLDCPIPRLREGIVTSPNTFPEDECEANCPDHPSNFPCRPVQSTGVGIPELYHRCRVNTSFETEKVIYLIYHHKERCNGIILCPDGDDEADCEGRFYCVSKKPKQISIRDEQTCDGVEHCVNGTDETEELCRETRFHCPTLGGFKVNIDRDLVCDFSLTCDDGSDEMNCTDERFYCENGDPLFVKARQTFDGRGDCSDWSDECPSSGPSRHDTFSSRYELIGNAFLRALVWIMGLLSVIGNMTVLFREGTKLKKSRRLSPVSMANRLLVLNLAASDSIMGMYLISLAIVGLTMQGGYCSKDLIWRSSNSCVALGVMTVLSSETSVITMVLLTACRLYAVLRPFQSSRHPKILTILLMIATSWVASLLIALIPLSPNLSNLFVTKAEFEYNPYGKNVLMSLDGAKDLFKKLVTYDLKPNVTLPENLDRYIADASWKELKAGADTYFSQTDFSIVNYFGYYSIHSVCIPKFFVTRSEPAWVFSFAVNLFNFIAFMFVATAYGAIYVTSNKAAKLRSSTVNDKDKEAKVLQRKILRLIITDFFCWIPICVMAFCRLGGVALGSSAYAVAAIVLLPINSALNPLLYSDLPDVIFNKLRPKSRQQVSTSSGSRNDGNRVTLKTNMSHSDDAATKEEANASAQQQESCL